MSTDANPPAAMAKLSSFADIEKLERKEDWTTRVEQIEEHLDMSGFHTLMTKHAEAPTRSEQMSQIHETAAVPECIVVQKHLRGLGTGFNAFTTSFSLKFKTVPTHNAGGDVEKGVSLMKTIEAAEEFEKRVLKSNDTTAWFMAKKEIKSQKICYCCGAIGHLIGHKDLFIEGTYEEVEILASTGIGGSKAQPLGKGTIKIPGKSSGKLR
ncbi:hypothetical protein K470DRAFT_270759 [Piedraia hortae CBS 480.64]|uniref:Uncharacterized protein n=1 Tax=Piedraia hortae CBS 480.64 TaxID=1314780 RepID=A0A6A7C0D0_9PEZI|nr:hypothetical protein K470DRAFT_270759 [Piedraia hortae CBS 480.64]